MRIISYLKRHYIIFLFALLSAFIFYNSYFLYFNLHEFICPERLGVKKRYLCYYSEQAFYYSYYKKFMKASNLSMLYKFITKDVQVEHPATINPFHRFNLLPEVLATLTNKYIIQNFFSLGLSEESFNLQFFLNIVFCCFGLLMVSIFTVSSVATKSLAGGIVAAWLCYFHFYYLSRAQNHPFLRENFAMPFLYFQTALLCYILRQKILRLTNFVFLFFLQTTWLLLWQFSQFPSFLQVMSLLVAYLLGYTPSRLLRKVLLVYMLSVICASLIMFGNEMLFNSILLHSLLVCFAITFLFENLQAVFYNKTGFLYFFINIGFSALTFLAAILLSFGSKYFFTNYALPKFGFHWSSDAHIAAIFYHKFKRLINYFPFFLRSLCWRFLKKFEKDINHFDSSLYDCGGQYQFLPFFILNEMKSTWLLYLSVLGLVLSLIKIFWDWWFLFSNKKRAPLQAHKKVFDPALPFLVSQSAAFIMLGLFIMRMLPFFTPSLAFLAGYLFTHHVDFLLPFALHKHSFLKEKRITCTICFGNNTDQLRERKKERNTNKNTDTLARQRRPNKFRNILLTNKNELQLKRPNLSSFIGSLSPSANYYKFA